MIRSTIPLMLSGLMALAPACFAADESDDKSDAQAELFLALDRDGDGTLKSNEIDEAQRKAFERLLRVGDSNGDGNLTRDEYLKGLQPDAPVQIDQPGRRAPAQRGGQQRLDVGRLFEMGDRDGDGKIALEDLPEPLQERLQPLFERLGKDEVTREDFEQMRRMTGGRPPGPAGDRPQMALLRVLDSDGNGQLNKSELAQIAEKFSELDRNQDGQLGPGELIGFAAGMPARGDARRPGATPRPERTRRPDEAPETARPRPEPGDRRPQGRGVSQIIREYDKDGDGALSREEAPERMSGRFERMDADGDDKVSADELERAFGVGRRRNSERN